MSRQYESRERRIGGKRVLRVLLVCVMLTSVPSACKEGNPISSEIAPATPAFQAQQVPAGVTANYVSMRSQATSGGRITLDIVVTAINEPITGIALKLTYPNAFSKFVSCSDGSLFPPGPCHFAEPSEGSGEVFIGRSVNGVNQATAVAGDQIIVRVEFLVFGVGNGAIVVEGQNLGGSDTSAVLDLNGDPIVVNWYTGTLIGM